MKKEYTGINIQWPISELILNGKKTIETRSYPIPKHYLGKEMVLIETPGRSGKFKSRMRAIIVFTNCFEYENKESFYDDTRFHCVVPDSDWAWRNKKKWGWSVVVKKVFHEPISLSKRIGIKYTNNLSITQK